MSQLKAYVPVISLFCLALLVRIVYNITTARGYIPMYDAAVYNNLAHSIVVEHCYCYFQRHPTVFRPPLWPYMIATIYFFAGEHSAYARLFCCLLGSGTCVLVYFLAKDLFGQRIALITGLIAAVYTGLFIWDGWLYTESLYTFCLTAYLFSLSRLQHSSRPVWSVLSGLFLGLAALTRPNGVILLGLLCLWAMLVIVFKILPWQRAVRNALFIVLIALAITLPWTLRNYTVTHSVMPVSTVGTTLAGAYNDIVVQKDNGLYGLWWLPLPLNADFHDHSSADEQADAKQAFAWMGTHRNIMPSLLGLHLLHMWTPYIDTFDGLPFEEFPDRHSSKIIRDMIPLMSIPIFLLAALGLLVTWKRSKKDLLVVYLVIALTIVQNIVFYGSPRFRAPIEPLLVLLAGGALWWLICDEPGTLLHFRFRKQHRRKECMANTDRLRQYAV